MTACVCPFGERRWGEYFVWRAVGCLRHQTPASLWGCATLVGFLLFDYWIVDASITHEGRLSLFFSCPGLLVGASLCVTFVVLYIVLCLDHFIAQAG